MKEGIFIGTQFTQTFKDQDFRSKLNYTERRGCKAFENICRNFLGKENLENYSEITQKLISSFSAMGLAFT
jgi:succinate dehydrogenase flavin-adding protein (antitoxin of CptAB toxin-antitoxin module)